MSSLSTFLIYLKLFTSHFRKCTFILARFFSLYSFLRIVKVVYLLYLENLILTYLRLSANTL